MRRLLRGRGRWLAALVLLAAGTGVGTAVGLAQTGGGGDDEARLRVEGPAEAVPCGERFPVTVYLDELAARPSPHGEGVEWGLGAIGLRLGYDPQVLRVEEDADAVQPDPDVEEVDADGNGSAASFLPIGPFIDNQKGEVFFSEFWVGVDPDTEQRYEGPSPAWAGGPVPLFSVTFLANGAGSSALTLSGVEMVDPLEGWYRPVGLEEGSVTVSGGEGECPELPLPAPKPTPRPAPTAPPTWTPVPTPTPAPPPQAVQPLLASDGGRPDCPDGWYVYNDPDGHFSICYPASWDAIPVRTPEQTTDVQLSTAVEKGAAHLPENYVSIAINVLLPGWSDDTSCEKAAANWGGVPAEAGVLSLSGVEAATCQGRGPTELWGDDPLQAVVPIDPDGTSLLIFAFKTGPDVSSGAALIEEVLRTLAPGTERGQ